MKLIAIMLKLVAGSDMLKKMNLPRTELTSRRELRLRSRGAFMRGKPLFLVFAFCFLFFAFASPVQAAQGTRDWLEGQSTSQYNQTQAGTEITGDTIYTMVVALAGCPQGEQCPDNFQYGAMQTLGNLIAGLYANPPASGVMYALDVWDNFRLAKPAYAQGTGFSALQPLLPIWRAFRNFTYLLFAIAFVGVGLAIMFRAKISPQAVITIQSALPQIVVALLLVTFSYAIAGFVVDLIYVAIALAMLIFTPILGQTDATALQTQFFTGGFGNTIGALFNVAGAGSFTAGGVIGAILGGVVGWIAGFFGLISGGLLVIGLGAGLILLIFLLIMVYLIFKLFLELLKAYVGIVVAVILGPLQILLGVIPGFPGFSQWFKNLAVNAAVFPAVAFALILGRVLIHKISFQNLWAAPLLGGGDLIPMLIGFGILLIVYQIPPALKKALGAEGFGFAPGAAVGAVTGPFVAMGTGLAAGAGWERAARAMHWLNQRNVITTDRYTNIIDYLKSSRRLRENWVP